jgi:hypothetical protein
VFKETRSVRARQASDELTQYSKDHPNLSTEEMSLKRQSITERFGVSLEDLLVGAQERLAEARAELAALCDKFESESGTSSPVKLEPIDEEPIDAVNDIRGAALEISALRIVKGVAGKPMAESEEDECFATGEEYDEHEETVTQIMGKYCPLMELWRGGGNFPHELEFRVEEMGDAIWGEVIKMEEEFQIT